MDAGFGTLRVKRGGKSKAGRGGGGHPPPIPPPCKRGTGRGAKGVETLGCRWAWVARARGRGGRRIAQARQEKKM